MNILTNLNREHSKAITLKVVQFVGNNQERFDELIRIFMDGPNRVTQRASWPLSICVEQHPALINKHWTKVLDSVNKPGAPDAVRRNVLRLMQYAIVPKKHHGKVIDLCYQVLQKADEPVAIKVFAMSVLSELIRDIPELQKELRILLEDQFEYGTPGFRSRAKKILAKLPV